MCSTPWRGEGGTRANCPSVLCRLTEPTTPRRRNRLEYLQSDPASGRPRPTGSVPIGNASPRTYQSPLDCAVICVPSVRGARRSLARVSSAGASWTGRSGCSPLHSTPKTTSKRQSSNYAPPGSTGDRAPLSSPSNSTTSARDATRLERSPAPRRDVLGDVVRDLARSISPRVSTRTPTGTRRRSRASCRTSPRMTRPTSDGRALGAR